MRLDFGGLGLLVAAAITAGLLLDDDDFFFESNRRIKWGGMEESIKQNMFKRCHNWDSSFKRDLTFSTDSASSTVENGYAWKKTKRRRSR